MSDSVQGGTSPRRAEGWLRYLVPAVAISGLAVGVFIELETVKAAIPSVRYLPYVFIFFAGFFGAVRSTMGSAAIGGGLAGFFVALAGGIAFLWTGQAPFDEGWKSVVAGLIALTTMGIVIGTLGGLPAWLVRKYMKRRASETQVPQES